MSYWQSVARRAWQDTAKTLKLDSGELIVVLLVTQLIIGAIVFFTVGNEGLMSNVATRIATATSPFLLFLPLYLWKFARAPAQMATEAEERANAAQAQLDQRARRIATKDIIGRFVKDGQVIHKRCQEVDMERAAEHWANRAYEFIEAAFGSGEATLFADNSGFVFFSGGNNSQVRNWVDGRLRRLTELLQRSDTIEMRPEFDPNGWFHFDGAILKADN